MLLRTITVLRRTQGDINGDSTGTFKPSLQHTECALFHEVIPRLVAFDIQFRPPRLGVVASVDLHVAASSDDASCLIDRYLQHNADVQVFR